MRDCVSCQMCCHILLAGSLGWAQLQEEKTPSNTVFSDSVHPGPMVSSC